MAAAIYPPCSKINIGWAWGPKKDASTPAGIQPAPRWWVMMGQWTGHLRVSDGHFIFFIMIFFFVIASTQGELREKNRLPSNVIFKPLIHHTRQWDQKSLSHHWVCKILYLKKKNPQKQNAIFWPNIPCGGRLETSGQARVHDCRMRNINGIGCILSSQAVGMAVLLLNLINAEFLPPGPTSLDLVVRRSQFPREESFHQTTQQWFHWARSWDTPLGHCGWQMPLKPEAKKWSLHWPEWVILISKGKLDAAQRSFWSFSWDFHVQEQILMGD